MSELTAVREISDVEIDMVAGGQGGNSRIDQINQQRESFRKLTAFCTAVAACALAYVIQCSRTGQCGKRDIALRNVDKPIDGCYCAKNAKGGIKGRSRYRCYCLA